MKTFLRKNKLRLFILGIPVLCLVMLWSINFHKIWYNHTSWQNLGQIRHATAVKIMDYQFDTIWGLLVLGDDGEIYHANFDSQWNFNHGFPFEYAIGSSTLDGKGAIQQKRDCANELQLRWGFKDHYFHDVISTGTFGYCSPFVSDYTVFDYTAFQIRENGEVWGKYFESRSVYYVRSRVTLYFCIFLILAAPVWMKLFVDYEPLKPKPDYNAK